MLIYIYIYTSDVIQTRKPAVLLRGILALFALVSIEPHREHLAGNWNLCNLISLLYSPNYYPSRNRSFPTHHRNEYFHAFLSFTDEIKKENDKFRFRKIRKRILKMSKNEIFIYIYICKRKKGPVKRRNFSLDSVRFPTGKRKLKSKFLSIVEPPPAQDLCFAHPPL